MNSEERAREIVAECFERVGAKYWRQFKEGGCAPDVASNLFYKQQALNDLRRELNTIGDSDG